MLKISKQWLTRIHRPLAHSHKGDNGRLLIIAGSKKYHGSLVLCATMASKIVDLVYIYTTPENFKLLQEVRAKLAEFIYIKKSELEKTIAEADAILVGPGLLPDGQTKKLVSWLLKNYPNKKVVLDAGALRVLDLKLLHKNCVLTPHIWEFWALFRKPASAENAKIFSQKYSGVLVLKGATSYICQSGRVLYNTTGNAGMTKGGTGDVLAGLLAALLTKNDPLTSAAVAVYVNGRAGDNLKKRFGFYYSAGELIPEVQKLLK